MKKREIVSSGVIIKNQEGKFLVFRRGEPHNDLSFPKGKVEAGESLEDAAIRECFEETGLKAKILKSLGFISYKYYWPPTDELCQKTAHYFLAEAINDHITGEFEKEDNVLEIGWRTKDEIFAALDNMTGKHDDLKKIIEPL